METKVNIVLKHISLANEYTKLANSSHKLSSEEWNNINKRKNEIMQEIKSLRDIESTWDLTNLD